MPADIPATLPPQLCAVPNWVAWKSETRSGSAKATKVPYSLNTGRRASSTAAEDWSDFPSQIPDGYDGIGFVFTKSLRITGIDLDNCLTASGEVKPWAADILARFSTTYSEVSPSGKGIKIWAGGSLSGSGRKVYVTSEGKRAIEGSTEIDGTVELYDTGRYFTVTGRMFGAPEVTDCQVWISKLYSLLRPIESRRYKEATAGNDAPVTEGGRHGFLLATAALWRNSGMDQEGILTGLRDLNRKKCNPPKPDNELSGIVSWLATKPPKYKLVPSDLRDGSAEREPDPVSDEQPSQVAPETTLERAERLLVAAIAAKDAELIFGTGTKASELIEALAKAGTIKQAEAKRRIRNALPKQDFPIREWDSRLRTAEAANRAELHTYSPFLVNATGSLKMNLANAIIMMNDLPIRYNSFTCRTYLEAKSPWGTQGNWADYDDLKAAEWCQHHELNVKPETVASAATAIAKARFPHLHPVAEYFRSITWDGGPRVNRWIVDYLGAEATEFVLEASAKWMIAAVKRIMEPGCQSDYTLVLEGEQGKRKSTALRILTGSEWFSDDISDIGSKDAAMQLQGKWIVELSELDAIRRAKEITTVKAWLVRRVDHFRPPYGRRPEDFPRQNVFAASTNRNDWGMDDTGLRRFWPIKVGEIDIEGLAAARDQLWAEAFARYQDGESSYLSSATEVMAAEEQSNRQDTDSWDELVLEWIEAPVIRLPKDHSPGEIMRSRSGRVLLPEILLYCLGIPRKDWTPVQRQRVSRILRLAGWSSNRAKRCDADPDGKRPEFWEPMNPRK